MKNGRGMAKPAIVHLEKKKPFVCKDCGDSFETQWGLYGHSKKHADKKPKTAIIERIAKLECKLEPGQKTKTERLEHDNQRYKSKLNAIYRTPRLSFDETRDIIADANLDADDIVDSYFEKTNSQYQMEKNIMCIDVYAHALVRRLEELKKEYAINVRIPSNNLDFALGGLLEMKKKD